MKDKLSNIKVMLIDDHILFVEGLKYMLEISGINIVGCFNNGMEAIKNVSELVPDVILLDIFMEGMDGIETLKHIKRVRPEIKVIILTTSEEEKNIYKAIKHGASGYFFKSSNSSEIVKTINTVVSNNKVFIENAVTKDIYEDYLRGVDGKFTKRYDNKLSNQQINILKFIIKGLKYNEIGKRMNITEGTVKYHMSRIIEILQAENRAQAISYAIKLGYIDDRNEK